MNFVANEVLIHELLRTKEGPVGKLIEFKANAVAEAAQQGIDKILWRMPVSTRPKVEVEIVESDEVRAIVGIEHVLPGPRQKESPSEYLAKKEQREHVWLLPAVEKEFGH